MNIRDFEYIVAVAELGNFSRAAERCHVSQPTLSAQIKKCEEQLAIPLFERSNRRVMLTETGQEIVAAARRLLNEMDNIRDISRMAQDPRSGRFRLGAFPTLASYLFPPLVEKLMLRLPRLRLILVEEKTADLIDQLKKGQLDAALIALPINDEALNSKPLFKDEFLLATPPHHALAKEKTITMSQLAAYRLLLLNEGHCLRDQAMEVCDLIGAAEQDLRATSLETLRQMVKAGTGITLMPKIAIHEEENGIHYVPFASPAPRRIIGLVWRKTTPRTLIINEVADVLMQGLSVI